MYLHKNQRSNEDQVEVCGQRKETRTDLHINWKLHPQLEWKIEAIRNLIKQANIVSSTITLMHEEIEHIAPGLAEVNEYPIKTVNKIINEKLHYGDKSKEHSFKKGTQIVKISPYKGKQGNKLVSKM